MLLDDDVIADGEAKPGAFSGRFGCEERIEHLFFHFRRNTGAVVADRDLYAVAEVLGGCGQGRLMAIAFDVTLARCVEAVRDEVEKCPRDILREGVDFTGGRVKRTL